MKWVCCLAVALASVPAACPSPETISKRTVLITFDGASDGYVDQLLRESSLDTDGFFMRSVAEGYVAEALRPVNVANTGPSHAALFSGSAPAASGIVGHNFTTPGLRLPSGTNAFQYVSDVETLVGAARRQGKRTACLAAPGLDGRAPNYACDFALSFSPASTQSQALRFDPPVRVSEADFFQPAVPAEFPGRAWQPLVLSGGGADVPLVISEQAVRLVAADLNPADDVQFDTLYIETGGSQRDILPAQTIFPYQSFEGGDLVMRALWVNKFDPDTGAVELYWGQTFKTVANDEMMEAVIAPLGAWPGELDARGLHAGRMSQEAFDAHNAFQAEYALKAVELMLQQDGWDLLIGYVSYLDTVQHEYLVTDPRQVDFAENGEAYGKKVEAAYRLLDKRMGQILGHPAAGNTNFLIASDHGMIPTHTAVQLSSIIETWGYSVYGPVPDIGVFSSGASAHIYINDDSRPGGKFTWQEKLRVAADLEMRFRLLSGPSGETVFRIVEPRSRMSSLDLDHPQNAGDLFISAAEGYGLDQRPVPTSRLFYPVSFNRASLLKAGLVEEEVAFAQSGFFNQSSPGTHGHTSDAAGISAILYAAGPAVQQARGGVADSLQIAPAVACLMGMEPPADAHYGEKLELCLTGEETAGKKAAR